MESAARCFVSLHREIFIADNTAGTHAPPNTNTNAMHAPSHTHTRTHSHTHTLTHSHTHTLTHSHTHHALTHSNTHTLTHPHTHTLTHLNSHTLTHSNSHTLITHSHTHTLSHSHTHTLTHPHTHTRTHTHTHTHTVEDGAVTRHEVVEPFADRESERASERERVARHKRDNRLRAPTCSMSEGGGGSESKVMCTQKTRNTFESKLDYFLQLVLKMSRTCPDTGGNAVRGLLNGRLRPYRCPYGLPYRRVLDPAV